MKNFIADSADVFGDVKLGKGTTIWFHSVLRGDTNKIIVGEMSNIQDGTVIHVDPNSPVKIEDYVTIGHSCIIHGCTIKSGALIGMGSIILNNAEIGGNSIIGAGSLITEGTVIPENTLAFGSPARVIREITIEELEKNKKNAIHYQKLGQEYLGNTVMRLE